MERSETRLGKAEAAAIALLGGGITAAVFTGVTLTTGPDPPEVKELIAVINRLSRSNDLGARPISFMVASGSYASYLAEERGFCEKDRCVFFAQLNPYKTYANGWNELIRQSYALGDIQAWSFSTGTIVIPQATFRAYGPHSGYLACTVAHEIAHFQRDHVFQASYHEHHNLNERSEEDKSKELNRWSRKQELEADRDAADMLARAGYDGRVCKNDIAFMHRSVGIATKTDDDSTHPGYEERLAAIEKHYKTIEASPPDAEPGPPAQMHYDADTNLLRVIPQPRQS